MLPIALVAFLVVACNGGGGSDDGDAAAGPTVPASALRDLCSLITVEEAGQYLEEPAASLPIGAQAPQGEDEPLGGYAGGNCIYQGSNPGSVKTVVVFAWAQGEEYEPAEGLPADIETFCEEQAQVEGEPDGVEGLGDAAFQHGDAGLFVVDSGVCLSVWVSLENENVPEAEAKERDAEIALAEAALARLREMS
jgi:hypothetical protein